VVNKVGELEGTQRKGSCSRDTRETTQCRSRDSALSHEGLFEREGEGDKKPWRGGDAEAFGGPTNQTADDVIGGGDRVFRPLRSNHGKQATATLEEAEAHQTARGRRRAAQQLLEYTEL